MEKTSKPSGAKGADEYFDSHYRDENGKVLWDKIRKEASSWPTVPHEEFMRLGASRRAIAEQRKRDKEKE